MPWIPELFSETALERIRREAAEEGAAEPVRYFGGVRTGEGEALVGSFAGEPELHHPSLTLLSDGEQLTGAYALGSKAGGWLQRATLAIHARVRLDVLRDTIQPFPSFSEIPAAALKALRHEIAAARHAVGAGS